jgi:hypothetical protein
MFTHCLSIAPIRPAAKLWQGFSKVAKIVAVAAISNRALSSRARTRLGNRGYIRDFGKTLQKYEFAALLGDDVV